MKSEKNILIAFILNMGFSIFEIVGGFYTNSISIMSDAIHDSVDALSIGLSYFLEKKSKKNPDLKFTYGYVRYSLIGSIITTFLLVLSSLIVIISSMKRIFNPMKINYNGMLIFALFGVIINLLASYVTKDSDSLNQKAVNLHMLEDVLNWVIVLFGALIIKFTDIYIIDSFLSIIISVFILIHAIKNLKYTIDIFLEKVPNNASIKRIIEKVKNIKSVIDVHHVHLWSMDGITNYATLHVVTKKYDFRLKKEIKELLKNNNIDHVTIEFELFDELCEEKNVL